MPEIVSPEPKANIRSNVLHGYANYTYNLQLWALTMSGFNKIAKGEITLGKEEDIIKSGAELLISNSGADSGERSPSFPVDFAIDNLEIESIVGNKGPQARSVDALSIKFDIIEPYGATLLNRLTSVVLRNSMGPDFKTMVYCLKIQFFGYDDQGKITKIEGVTKYIPLSILNMKFSLTNKGAVYNVEAIPPQNICLTMIDNQVPFHVELQGQTVGELFDATAAISTQSNNRADAATTPYGSNTVVTKGIAYALAENENYRVNNGAQNQPNEYNFKFSSDILSASVIDPKKLGDDAMSFSNLRGANGQKSQQSGRYGDLTLDTKSGTVRAQAGTRITDLIGSILSVSSYMKEQVAQSANRSKPFNGWKIIPSLEILGYDTKTNFFRRKVTYTTTPFAYYGEDHPNLPQKTVEDGQLVKEYEYFFTGNNKDIIKANLDFNIAFFETVNAAKKGYAVTPEQSFTDNQNDSRLPRSSSYLVNGIGPAQNSANGTDAMASMVIAEMMTRILDNNVDLLSLDIEIVGDPDWIQQDSVLYGSSVLRDQKTLSNGTINYQGSGTYFKFTFKTPVQDYDDTTGMFNVKDQETVVFSGIYQVISIKNSFRKGKFTQSLKNVRVRIQKEAEVVNSAAKVQQQLQQGDQTLSSNSLSPDNLVNNVMQDALPRSLPTSDQRSTE